MHQQSFHISQLFSSFFLILLCSLLLFSCKKVQKGTLSSKAQTQLEVLAERDIETDVKFLEIAKILSKVLEEALAKDDDAAMISHLKDFHEMNEDALRMLTAEIDFWFKYVDNEEKNEFLMRYWPNDFAKSLRSSEAKFFRRTRQRPEYAQHFRRVTRPLEMRK